MREQENTSRGVGRPREFDEDDVIEKIMALFWEQGYEGTGLSDIMTATGLQKGSLYKAFGSKHEMYVRALAYYESQAVDGGVKMLTGSEPPQDRLRNFLSAPLDAAYNNKDKRGCFLCNASADFAALDPDTSRLVKRGYNKLLKALKVPIAQIFLQASPKDIDAKASLALSFYSGQRIMARASVAKPILESGLDAVILQFTKS